VDHHSFGLWVMRLRGVYRVSVADISLRFVLNQTRMEWEVGRQGGGGTFNSVRSLSTWVSSVRAQFGLGGGDRKTGASKGGGMGIWSEPVEGRGSHHCEK